MIASAPRRGRAWRWRQCPACRKVERASDFAAIEYREPWQNGGTRRRCPNCGHRATTRAFAVVRERHP